MRPRVEIAITLAVLIVLGVLAGSMGSRTNRAPLPDSRRSTFLTTPYGARAYAEALGRLDVRVDRFRQRTAWLGQYQTKSEGTVLVLLDPLNWVDGTQAADLVDFLDERGDLLLSGVGTSAVMRCFGYDVDYRGEDSTAVFRKSGGVADLAPVSWTRDQILARRLDSVVTDSTDIAAGVIAECEVREPVVVDTLLVTAGGRPAAVRLLFGSGTGRVTLVADGMLFSNSRMRESDAGLATLPMIAGKYDRAVFDEYEHGFGPSGSLLRAVGEWSVRSPVGWAAWQLAVVGLLALLAGAIRFGAPRNVIDRRRRSPLEHVRALATALAAAKGVHVAVDLVIKGLRRRLSAGGQPVRGDVMPWLESLAANVRSTRSRQAVTSLMNLTRRAPVSDSVLRAANAVEDVWEDLKPPSSTR